MSYLEQDDTIPDPMIGRRRSRVDAFMPWSSLESLRPIKSTPVAKPIRASGPIALPGGCRLYRFPMVRHRRVWP